MPVLVGLPDENGFPHASKVESADTRMDPNTGTARWRALLPNADGLLMPGMYVRVRLVTSGPVAAILVPETAVGSDQGQRFVYVVTDQNVVRCREVKLGVRDDDGMRVVEEGLTADDWVIEKGAAMEGRDDGQAPEKAGGRFAFVSGTVNITPA